MLIANETNDSTVCDRAKVAVSLRERMFGLLGRRTFELGEGLLLRTTSAVHTFGMLMAIDVIGLDARGRVMGICADMKPGRVAFFGWKTKSVLEVPAGQSLRARVNVGDRLVFSDSWTTRKAVSMQERE